MARIVGPILWYLWCYAHSLKIGSDRTIGNLLKLKYVRDKNCFCVSHQVSIEYNQYEAILLLATRSEHTSLQKDHPQCSCSCRKMFLPLWGNGGTMSRDLLELVLPRLARRLNRHLRRFRAGQLTETQFSQKFEGLLQQQYSWLANQGIPELQAAVAIHAAVVILSGPGLEAEAQEQGLPLEVIEYRAIQAAASDLAENYGIRVQQAVSRLSGIVAQYLG